MASLVPNQSKKRVVVVGGGSFGSAIANRLALNVGPTGDSKEQYESEVQMWLYDEIIEGRKLSEIINESHENIKYLPGIKLPNNLHVTIDMAKTVQHADVIFIVIPHQHIHATLKSMMGHVKPDTIIVSMIKGLKMDKNGPELISSVIRKTLSTENIAVVMGANIASDVARGEVVDGTVASPNSSVAQQISALLHCAVFRTRTCLDVSTVEICGALKNVIAMGAGFSDALKLGHSTKAAILRQGLAEIGDFCHMISPTTFKPATLLESCGFPDLVASSYGGRNRLCSATFVERRLLQKSHSTTPTNLNSNSGTQTIVTATGVEAQSATIDNVSSHDLQLESLKLWREIEKELLNGQSMQGIETCIEVMDFLDELEKPDSVKFATLSVECGGIPKFNLIRKIGAIALKGEDPTTLLDH